MSARFCTTLGGAVIALLAATLVCPALSQNGAADEIVQPLGGMRGDPVRGRLAVADREGAHCLLCHQLPIADERFHGDLGPPLAGVGSRLTPAQIRLRLVDSAVVNPQTIMPPYFRTEGLARVSRQYQGRTVLSEQQIEDIVAYLAGLKE